MFCSDSVNTWDDTVVRLFVSMSAGFCHRVVGFTYLQHGGNEKCLQLCCGLSTLFSKSVIISTFL